MNELNPELTKQVATLAELCCDRLDRQTDDVDAKTRPILESLVTNGYSRWSDTPLQVRLERTAKEICPQRTMHRHGELQAITGDMQKSFKELERWTSQRDQPDSGTKPANISSMTNS